MPDINDALGIVLWIRLYGSVAWPDDEVPADFLGWRRGIRQAGIAAGIRVGVTRTGGCILVHIAESCSLPKQDIQARTRRADNRPRSTFRLVQ